MRGLKLLWLALCGGLFTMAAPALGHDVGESYVWLNVEETHFAGRVEIRLADLRERFGLEITEDVEDIEGARAQIAATAGDVHAYIREHFEILIDDVAVPYEFTTTNLGEAPKFGHYAQYEYRTTPLDVPDVVTVRNDMLFELGPLQRSLLCIAYNRKLGEEYGDEFTATVFSPATPERTWI